MSRFEERLLRIGVLLFVVAGPVSAQTIYVSLESGPLEGKPMFWNDDFIALMGRDGKLATFAPGAAREFRQVSPGFQSHSQATMRGELLREFGTAFDVSGTGQFLVVHPAGQRDRWADRFEQLYRSMVHYLSVRGLPTERPEFPLVAIVFPSQQQYVNYIEQQGSIISTNTLGFYDPTSNRITMYDVTSRSAPESLWHVNAETIIHEAAHQTAYNVGIHNRLGQDPRWVVEGLGTMFEAPGVWNSRHHPNLEDRVQRGQLETYRRSVAPGNTLALLQQQITSDQPFQRTTATAYAHAWALTFYLTEREPQRYADYLRRLKTRPSFQQYPAEERLRDFVASFGTDLKMFNARLQRFIAEL
jgi:hypothetical protein